MDDDTDTGAYNPDLADTGDTGGAAEGVDSMSSMPPPTEDQGSRKEEANWWRSIMDAARQQFGISDVNANAAADKDANTGLAAALGGPDIGKDPEAQSTGLAADLGGNEVGQVDHEPAGLPKQAGEEQDEVPGQAEPTGLPQGGNGGEEDPEAQAYGNPGALPPAGGARPADGKNPQRIIQYLTGHGGEDKTATEAREHEVEAKLPPGTGKAEVRNEALKQNLAANGPEGALPQYQAHKAQYNKFKVLAGAALDHNDRNAAAQLFNEATTYLPGDKRVIATTGANGGMNINIQDPNGPTKDLKLTGDQFRELTHMRVGEWDHVLERGFDRNIEDLAKTAGMPQAPGQQSAQPQAQAQPNKPGRDQSPEARANRVYPWVSQSKQRELLAEKYRQEDQKQKNTERGLDIKDKESDRKHDYGTENLNIKREAIAQRDRHLGYLVDKSTGELNEKMLTHLEQTNGRNASNFVRYMDAKIRAGDTLTDQEKQSLDQVRQKAMTPASRPSTLNGGGNPPASARGAVPPPGSTAPPPGEDPRGKWQINTATQQRRWVPFQQ